jgi:APA family basic amino acid/polyamine antiporter
MNALARQLGLASATAVVIGETIAVGIFLVPAGMAKTLASPALLLAVWLGMGAVAVCGALCYGELASRYPEAGGGYVYLREAYGPRVAFLYGWKCLLVMDPGIAAALGVGFAGYAQVLLGFPDWGLRVAAVAAILALAGVNMLGVRVGASFTRWLTALKLAALAGIALWGFGAGLGDWSHFVPFAARPENAEPLVGALAGGLVGAFFAFGGWWDTAKLAGEVRDPGRTLPLALALGVAGVTAVYVVTSAVFLYLVPVAEVTSDETFAAQAGERLFGPAGAAAFSAVVIVSVLGSLAALLMAAPRVYYAMARDGLFPAGVAAVHPRFGTPARAIALQAALASLLALTGTFRGIVAYFIFVTVAFIALTVGAVYVLRRRGGRRPAYSAFGYPITPAIFIVQAAVLMALLAAGQPLQALAGTAVVLLGIPVYSLVRR